MSNLRIKVVELNVYSFDFNSLGKRFQCVDHTPNVGLGSSLKIRTFKCSEGLRGTNNFFRKLNLYY